MSAACRHRLSHINFMQAIFAQICIWPSITLYFLLRFYLFADDTNICCESNTVDSVVKRANSELRKVKKWLDAKRLSININKTNYIIFHSPHKHIPPHFLGLLLDDTLSWKYHLSEPSKKLAKTCELLYKIRPFLPTEALICLSNSLFMSFLQYGITLWVKRVPRILILLLNYRKSC